MTGASGSTPKRSGSQHVAITRIPRRLPAFLRQTSKVSAYTSSRCEWIALIFVLSLIVPTWASFYAGSLRLTAYRVVLLACFFPAVTALLSGKLGKILLCDWLVALHAAWAVLAIGINGGFIVGAQSGGVYIVETFGAYMLARWSVRSPADYSALSKLACILVVALAFITVPESLTGKDLLAPNVVHIDPRHGFQRAFGPFDHPIHNGVFCAAALGQAWYVLGYAALAIWPICWVALVVVSAATSVSSGAVAAVAIQLGIIGWDLVTRKIKRRWLLLASLILGMYVFVAMTSNRSPLTVAISYLTFDSATGYERELIWSGGISTIKQSPVFGIGLTGNWEHEDWMSGSMDNYWLYNGVSYGIPAFILLASATLYIVWRTARATTTSPQAAACRMGWVVSILGLIVAACTVHFWNALLAFFFFSLGTGVWIAERSRTERMIPSPGRNARRVKL